MSSAPPTMTGFSPALPPVEATASKNVGRPSLHQFCCCRPASNWGNGRYACRLTSLFNVTAVMARQTSRPRATNLQAIAPKGDAGNCHATA